MKKLLVLVLAVFMIYGCKAKQSKVSSLVEQAGKVYYLFGSSSGEDGTSIVCRYTCAKEPKQETKRSLCSSPLYVKKDVLQSSNLSNFLKYIEDNSKVFMRKQFDQSTDNRLATLFYQAEEEKEVYDTSIGDPDQVCDNVLESGNGGLVTDVSITENIEDPDKVGRKIEVGDTGSPTGKVVEKTSLNEIKTGGYPVLIMYGFDGCGACSHEKDNILTSTNVAKLKEKMHVYHVETQSLGPCGGGYPQNQFFNAEGEEVACQISYGGVQQMVKKLSGVKNF